MRAAAAPTVKLTARERRALAVFARPVGQRDYRRLHANTIHALERKGLIASGGRRPGRRLTAAGREALVVPDIFADLFTQRSAPTGTMEPFKSILSVLAVLFPETTTTVHPPARDKGAWALDVDLADVAISVEWDRDTGYGISTVRAESYGEGPDERYPDEVAALARLLVLLGSGQRTAPQAPTAEFRRIEHVETSLHDPVRERWEEGCAEGGVRLYCTSSPVTHGADNGRWALQLRSRVKPRGGGEGKRYAVGTASMSREDLAWLRGQIDATLRRHA